MNNKWSKKTLKSLILNLEIAGVLIVAGIVLYNLNFGNSMGPNYRGEYWTIWDNMTDPFSFEPGLCIDIGILWAVISAAVCFIRQSSQKAKEQAAAAEEAKRLAFEREHPHYEAEKFYAECRSAGLMKADSPAERARLKLFAQNAGIDGTEEELVARYQLGKQETERLKQVEQQAKKEHYLAELWAEESKEAAEDRRFVDLRGTAKTIAVYQEIYDQAFAELQKWKEHGESIRRGGQALYDLNKQQEKDWAIHGGLASGLAGGAAGLATALDIQQQNAVARQHNAQLATKISDLQIRMIMENDKRISAAQSKVDRWKNALEQAKLLLSDDSVSADELLAELAPQVKKAERTETGAIRLTIQTEQAERMIYGDVKAVIDGHIKAVLLCDGTRLGEAVFSLPTERVEEARETAICQGPVAKDCAYTVEFESIALWLREAK